MLIILIYWGNGNPVTKNEEVLFGDIQESLLEVKA